MGGRGGRQQAQDPSHPRHCLLGSVWGASPPAGVFVDLLGGWGRPGAAGDGSLSAQTPVGLSCSRVVGAALEGPLRCLRHAFTPLGGHLGAAAARGEAGSVPPRPHGCRGTCHFGSPHSPLPIGTCTAPRTGPLGLCGRESRPPGRDRLLSPPRRLHCGALHTFWATDRPAPPAACPAAPPAADERQPRRPGGA